MKKTQTLETTCLATGTTSPGVPRPTVAESVVCGLRQDLSLRQRDVTCEFHEGVLILRGCLPTYYLKQMAQTLAAKFEAVQLVDNRIVVRQHLPDMRQDL